MAYNRRGAANYMTSSASVGARRGNQQFGNNFVSGGQLQGKPPGPQQQQHQQQQQGRPQQQLQQQKPAQQPQNAAQRQQQMQHQQSLRQQAQQFLNQPQQQSAQQAQSKPPAQQPAPQATPQPAPQVTPQPAPQPAPQQAQQQNDLSKILFKPEPIQENTNGVEPMATDEDGSDKKGKKKPFWLRKDGSKINKKERLRRRNQRLRKILQPKNALMVLNELIGSAPYTLTETADMYEGPIFKCSVSVDGLDHAGVGKSKPSAKSAAAEAALKHMVMSKLKNSSFELGGSPLAAPEDATPAKEGEEKMDVDEEGNNLSWSHIACYALHKLLSSWDEGTTNLAEKLAQASQGATPIADKVKRTTEKKPAKKLPDCAAMMNPIMLLNQMHPNTVYEEIARVGNPPNVQFTVKCTVNDEAFVGQGSTKKGARKMCAFAACRKTLGIEYTPAFLEEHGFVEEAVSYCAPGSNPM